MKSMKKCAVTKLNNTNIKNKLAKLRYKRCSSAGMFYTSSAGAVTSLILVSLFSVFLSFCGFTGTTNTYASSSTLSLSVSNNVVDLNIIPTGTNGSFAKSGNTTITASTNNATGYTLSIAASSSTDYNKLKNGSDALTSVTEATTESAFKSLTATTYNGKWGYLPSKYCTGDGGSTCTTNTDFLPAPPASGDILDVTDAANTTANTYTLAIGARVDGSIKMGSYSNTYNVILVANAIPYTITYNDSVIGNMPVDVDSTSSASTVTLSNNTPTRAGYTFLGWCTTMPTTSSGTDSCSGTTYQPGGTYTLDQTGGSNNLNLYAMWQEITTLDKVYYMQDSFSCADTPIGTTSVLIDKRDNTGYIVGKAKDGNCWMLQNLKLGKTTTSLALTSANSDVGSAGFTLTNKLSDGKFHAYTIDGVANQNNSSEYYCTGDGTATDWESCYYNWYTATAGTGSTYISTQGQNVDSSICPAGWALPTQPQFSALYAQYNSAALMEVDDPTTTKENSAGKIPGFLLSGDYTGGANHRGSNGYYWSRTAFSAQRAYDLNVDTSSVYPAYSNAKYLGLAVRCIAQ